MTREELKQLIAEVSHKTWMKQKNRDQGVELESLDPKITDHDLERAEDILIELEKRGVRTSDQD